MTFEKKKGLKKENFLKEEKVDPFVAHCYNVWKDLKEVKTEDLFLLKTISWKGIRDVAIRLLLGRRHNNSYYFKFSAYQHQIYIRDMSGEYDFFDISKIEDLPSIKTEMSKENFCTKIDIELKKFLSVVDTLKFCNIELELTEEKTKAVYPTKYLSQWKDVELRETDCIICYEGCGTYLRCCKKPICIKCVSNIVEKSECPHCRKNHSDYDDEEGFDEDCEPHIFLTT